MGRFARSTNHGHTFVATCVFAVFVWALALSASPQLHQRVHKDANRVEHNCAVTMIASGSYNHAAHVPLVSAPIPAVQFSKILALTPCWVQSPFLGACIFEHAPPARG
jgi:heme A synthase